MEIKIRVWDVDRKRMLDSENIVFNNGKFYEDYRDFEDGITLKDIVVMQSTGLKDKNGVEIYEGDIVKILIDNGFDYVDGFGVVSFRQGGFVIDRNNLDTEFEWLYYAQDDYCVEVIGSIYENKDLLEG